MYSSKKRTDSAFTLLEMLIVLAVISILLGILMNAGRAVNHHSRVTIARSEVAKIESAWKEYYSTYNTWPTNAIDAKGTLVINNDNGIADMLQGRPAPTGSTSVNLNPKNVPFIEFTRFFANRVPANPWCNNRLSGSASNRFAYVTRFDIDFDNAIESPVSGEELIYRPVIVWTTDPETSEIIGSWEQ